MSVSIEKSGSKPKIPPDDYIKSERSKHRKKSKNSMSREPKPNLQKRISRTKNEIAVPASLHSIRELSAKEKNRRRIEEQREAQHFEYVKRSGSLKHAEIRPQRSAYQGIRRASSFGDPPKRRKRLRTRAERSRRAESVESSRQSGRSSQPKSQDSGIVLEESSDQGGNQEHQNEKPQLRSRSGKEEGSKERRRPKTIIDVHDVIDTKDDDLRFRELVSHDVNQEPTTPSGRPIVAFNNSDPDITIRFREQFRNLDLSSKSVTEKSPAENLARSDSDLLNIGHSLGISFDHVTRSIEIENKDEISDSDKLDDANKLNEGFKSENGRVDVDPVARLNDWIQEVDQKQKDLKTRSTVARKAETGWNSEADLCRPGSGLDQLSTFAERLASRKGKLIARHQSFAAIPSKPEVHDNSEHCESIGENQMNLQTGSIGDLNLPELSNSFRNKLAQWDDLGIVQRSNVDLRQRKKRGSSSASAVLQRMSLPVVNWVGGKDGQRTPEKVKDPNIQNKMVPEPGQNQMNQNKPVQTSLHQRQPSDNASNRTKQPKKSKNGTHTKEISKTAPKVVVETTQSQAANQIPEWEAQQKEENREFRARRKQRAKKCFPFSICA